jgi:hypothetical protein
MPDGQDKSDDLIAELAKLMASNAGTSPEPEAKPAPKLVTVPEAPVASAPAPSPAPIRIPGMDAPVVATPQPQVVPQPQVAPAVAAPPIQPAPSTPSVLRIPGMDQPVPVSPLPSATPAHAAAMPPKPMDAKPAASFDFGTVPAASAFKPEPMSNWQDREIPKPVPSRPATPAPVSVSPEPAITQPAPVSSPPFVSATPTVAPAPVRAELSPSVESSVAAPVARPAVAPAAPAAAPVSPMVEAAKSSSTVDSFDFDFGFSANPPAPFSAEASKSAVASPPKPAPAPAVSSGDPIADLIAAELDSADAEEAPPAAQPAPRSFPQPGLQAPRPAQSGPVSFRPQPTPQTASKPEERFGVAPSFATAGRSQVAARSPQPAADPMEEIESLIGEAVRVELTEKPAPAAPSVAPAPVATQSAPAVPPLTAGIPPRRAAIRERDGDHASPESAILAAAAASGAEVGRLDGVATEPSPYKRVKAKPERRPGGMRQYVGMAVAGTLLLAAGFGLYWVLGMGRGGSDAEAPVLTADATPVKEAAPVAPVASTTEQGAVVFNELDGGNATAPADEQLVSRDDSAETSVADVARTVGEGEGAATESELANRKVRTVTVRPDGTIVSGDEAVAGNEELPVARPNVPDLPGADVQPSELLAAIPGDAVVDPTGTPVSAEATGTTDPTQLSALAPTGPAPEIVSSIVAPIPVARPTNRAALNSGTSVAAAQPVDLGTSQPAATAAPVAVGGSGPYVQLSSQPSQADAESALRTTQNRLANILGGRSLAVRQVDLGAKGTWYRVVLPVPTFQDATDTCAGLKSNGIDCVPIGG